MNNSHTTIGFHFTNRLVNNRVLKDILVLDSSFLELRNYLMYFNNKPNKLDEICLQPLVNFNENDVPDIGYRYPNNLDRFIADSYKVENYNDAWLPGRTTL